MQKSLKTKLSELGHTELLELNTTLAEIASTAEQHLDFINSLPEVDRTPEDEDLCAIEEAFLFLYHAWSEHLLVELPNHRNKMH